MISRDLTNALLEAAREFSAVAVLGPRQSGKTTLVQSVFPNHRYVSLEDLDRRELARTDPRHFLEDFASGQGIILDEVQHVPELLSYMQTIIDRDKKKGFFIITGSQNLLVNEAVTQTLAGRIATLELYPLSINELSQAKLLSDRIEDVVFNGMYPRLYDEGVSPVRLYENYIRGYVERDVRQVKNIFDLNLFQKFLRLCAGRTGQILNLSSLSNDCDVDHKTVRSWISLLEASYIIFLVQPYYKNFGKRLIKAPKIYFVDTGVACSLLGIKSANDLTEHYARGGLVETFLMADFLKQLANEERRQPLYFWRDSTGNEIDCLVEVGTRLMPVEIKAGKTVNTDYFKGFEALKRLSDFPIQKNVVVYAGVDDQRWPNGRVISWQHAGQLIKNSEAL